MAFYVSQKVECVDDGPSKFTGIVAGDLKRGDVYTISAVGRHCSHPVVWLVEKDPGPGHYCFDARRFRPITERKTDISIFKAMLNPSKQEVSA